MSTKLKCTQEWIDEVAKKHGLSPMVVAAIYDSQLSFIREKMTTRDALVNIHVAGLGKFYSNKVKGKPNGKAE